MAKGRKTGGRKKGTPNKVTKSMREMVASLVEENLPLANEWLKAAWKTHPAEAAALFCRILEYAAPKYGRLDPAAETKANELSADVDSLSDAQLMAIVAADRATKALSETTDPNVAMAIYSELVCADHKPGRFPSPGENGVDH